MISCLLALALLGCLSVPCVGLPGLTQPTPFKAVAYTPAWNPAPTQAAVLQQKRDVGGNATCGFVGGVLGTFLMNWMHNFAESNII